MRYLSKYKEDTGFYYPDGTMIRTTDRVRIEGYDMLGTVHSRPTKLKDGSAGKPQYFVVIAQPSEVDPTHSMPYKQITLRKAVEMGVEWMRTPSTVRKMQMIVTGTEKERRARREGRRAYVVGPIDYDHVEVVYK